MSMLFWRGTGSVRFLPTIAGTAGPTAAEITAGSDLSAAVTAIAGFETQLNRVGVPVLSSSTELQTDGPQTFVDSSLTMVEDDGTGTDADSLLRISALTLLADGVSGYFVLSRVKRTLVTGDKVYVFPGKVGANNPGWTLDANVRTTTINVVLTAAARKAVAVI